MTWFKRDDLVHGSKYITTLPSAGRGSRYLVRCDLLFHWRVLADSRTASVTWSVARASRKVGAAWFRLAERFQKIGELMNERVLVSDLQARHPPVLHIRMIAVGDVDASPSAQLALIAMIEELDAMQIVEIPLGGRMLAVDFERIQRLVPARVAGGFKGCERAVLRSGRETRWHRRFRRAELSR